MNEAANELKKAMNDFEKAAKKYAAEKASVLFQLVRQRLGLPDFEGEGLALCPECSTPMVHCLVKGQVVYGCRVPYCRRRIP